MRFCGPPRNCVGGNAGVRDADGPRGRAAMVASVLGALAIVGAGFNGLKSSLA